MVVDALPRVPRYCRVTRVIRDISSDDIVVGNKRTNFRQIAEREVNRRGGSLVEIRHREIRGESFDPETLSLRETVYRVGSGRECFLELVTPQDRIVGFVRLSLPKDPSFVAELGRHALVRELHVYGGAVRLGDAPGGAAQHRGLGGRLLDAQDREVVLHGVNARIAGLFDVSFDDGRAPVEEVPAFDRAAPPAAAAGWPG